jgi:hypothetical protein
VTVSNYLAGLDKGLCTTKRRYITIFIKSNVVQLFAVLFMQLNLNILRI